MKKAAPAPPVLPLETQVFTKALEAGGEQVLSYSLSLPKFPAALRALRPVERYYRHVGERFRRRWEGELLARAAGDLAERRALSRPFTPWQAGLAPGEVVLRDGLLSITLEIFEDSHAGPAARTRDAVVWDAATGWPVSLREVLGRGCRRQALSAVEDQIQRQRASGDFLYREDYPRLVRKHFSPHRFFLSGGEAALFYPPCTLAPALEGIPTFSLPLRSGEGKDP